jgi:DNA polymerase IV (DinB-like DNA polymerase)
LTIVREEDAKNFLASLSVRKLLWVGRKTGQVLESRGIKTIGDLARFDPSVLVEMFGALGLQLHQMAHGIDRSEVEEGDGVKSIGRDVTFQEDTDDFEFVLRTLDGLSRDVHDEVLRQRLIYKTVIIRVRYENFETHTHGKTLPFVSDRLQDLTRTTQELIQPYFLPDRRIRLVGVRVSSLASNAKQKKLA